MRIIAGEARGRVIEAPRGLNTRPTLDRVRENLFNILQNQVYGKRVLDLFAGSGALSLEALSRGASFAVLADIDRNAFEVQKRNIALLRYEERTRQFRCDWLNAIRQLQKENERFDIVFLDPPYSMLDLRDVFTELQSVVNSDALIILEHQAGKQPAVTEQYIPVKSREWGFCGIKIYQVTEKGE